MFGTVEDGVETERSFPDLILFVELCGEYPPASLISNHVKCNRIYEAIICSLLN
jgi:hypothetical protein